MRVDHRQINHIPKRKQTHIHKIVFNRNQQRGRKNISIRVLLASAPFHAINDLEETLCFQNKSGFPAELINEAVIWTLFSRPLKISSSAGLEIGQ